MSFLQFHAVHPHNAIHAPGVPKLTNLVATSQRYWQRLLTIPSICRLYSKIMAKIDYLVQGLVAKSEGYSSKELI